MQDNRNNNKIIYLTYKIKKEIFKITAPDDN